MSTGIGNLAQLRAYRPDLLPQQARPQDRLRDNSEVSAEREHDRRSRESAEVEDRGAPRELKKGRLLDVYG